MGITLKTIIMKKLFFWVTLVALSLSFSLSSCAPSHGVCKPKKGVYYGSTIDSKRMGKKTKSRDKCKRMAIHNDWVKRGTASY